MSLAGIPSDSIGGGWTFRGNVRKARISKAGRASSGFPIALIGDYRPPSLSMRLVIVVEPAQCIVVLPEKPTRFRVLHVAVAKKQN
jgi:hypothetical protein